MYVLFRNIDPKKDPPCHRECVGRDMRGGGVKPLHDLVNGPVDCGSMCPDFYCGNPAPRDTADRRFGNNGSHRRFDQLRIGSAIDESANNHVTGCAVEWVKDEDSHLQYL
jgi:hypothetical protein